MAAEDAIDSWLGRLAQGDPRAAEDIWDQYFDQLVRLARRKLEDMPCRAADEEDVALSAMYSFCRGVQHGRFEKIENRAGLWKLLVTITARKACAQRRREWAAKRGSGRVRGESVFVRVDDPAEQEAGIEQVLGSEPTPELANLVAEDCRKMLASLNDPLLSQVATHTLEGYSTLEIAEKLGCVRRTVERKLERIREIWSRELPV